MSEHQHSGEDAPLRLYEVWSTYKVTGTGYVKARSAREAVEKALDTLAEDAVQFDFSEPHDETKMRARLIRPGKGGEADG